VQKLLNEGYIAQIRKKEIKYYISGIPKAIASLKLHGKNVVGDLYR